MLSLTSLKYVTTQPLRGLQWFYSIKLSTYLSLSIHSVDKSPEIVNVPVNQTAVLGSNVTFNCTATGYPKPTITWVKENDSSSVQYDPTPEILTGDGNIIFSQLVITEVKSNDYGIYHCVAKNSAGVKTSSATLGYRGIFCCVFDF